MNLADDFSALRAIPLLAPLSEAELLILRGRCAWAWYQPGEVIVRQGQALVDFCIVASGKVELLLEEAGARTRLGLLEAGDFFGELPALTGDAAPATVVAREVTSLLRLSHEGLMLLLDKGGDLPRQIIATLAARVRETGDRLHRARLRERSLSDHIARQGARTYTEWVGTGGWSQRVRAAIARGSRTTEPLVLVGEPGAGKELAAARIHYNSDRKDGPFIVLEGEEWSPANWQDALRMAAHGSLLIKRVHFLPQEAAEEIRTHLPQGVTGHRGKLPSRVPRLMFTAPAPDDRTISPVEQIALDEGAAITIPPLRERREDIPVLVRHLLKKHGLLPAGESSLQPVTGDALRKLQGYPFLGGNVRELERVIRQAAAVAQGSIIDSGHLRLASEATRGGRPRIGLALGGGVVRGCAHIGALRALEEAGIPVDYLAGTSSGALIGSLHAGGLNWRVIEELVSTTGWFDLAEPCWPRGAFLTSRRMRAFLDRHIGPVGFDDLRLPFVAVAADANRGQEVLLRQGRVADAVRASTAIPGVFRPVEFEGRTLLDGVLVNNVPANVVRSMGADLVIAVDVTSYALTSGAPRSTAEAMMRAVDIMARQTVSASLEWADVIIRPPVGDLNGFSFRSAPEFVRRGYQAAREALPQVLARLAELRSAGG